MILSGRAMVPVYIPHPTAGTDPLPERLRLILDGRGAEFIFTGRASLKRGKVCEIIYVEDTVEQTFVQIVWPGAIVDPE